MLVTALDNLDEVGTIQDELKALSQYPDMVLYASQGMQWTVRAQKMLNTLLPNNRLLLAYLKLNSSGNVASSHLLMDEGKTEPLPEQLALREEPVAREDPLLEPLRELKLAEQRNLKEMERALSSLLEDENREAGLAILDRLKELLKKHPDLYTEEPEKRQKQEAAIHYLR